RYRRDHPDLFLKGEYLPLDPAGSKREHLCAFARAVDGDACLVVVPRLVVTLAEGAERLPIGDGVWGDTWLPLAHETVGRRYRNVLTGEVLEVQQRRGGPGLAIADILRHATVACLERLPE
ncbi:MAG TPA: malto-oligosyltrehalose synthase, partial [Chloroflexota bacterium]